MILYEYPFNERIRTLLRLEDLFKRFSFFSEQDDPRAHHVALTTLFEISEITGRSDLKSDLVKELERQRQTLAAFTENPEIELDRLQLVLNSIAQALTALHEIQSRAGQHLSDNEWLGSIRSRVVIPGGTCKFDLPSYYAWQQEDAAQRRADIVKWVSPLLPVYDAAAIVLKLARQSGATAKVIAIQGSYQQMLSGRSYQLMQVHVPDDARLFPESSANKYMLWVRFRSQDGDLRPRPVDGDVPFQLTLCSL